MSYLSSIYGGTPPRWSHGRTSNIQRNKIYDWQTLKTLESQSLLFESLSPLFALLSLLFATLSLLFAQLSLLFAPLSLLFATLSLLFATQFHHFLHGASQVKRGTCLHFH